MTTGNGRVFGQRLSESETQKVERLLRNGNGTRTYRSIADETGVGRETVARIAKRIGIGSPNNVAARELRKGAILRLLREGGGNRHYQDIADEAGVGRQTVARIAKRIGIGSPNSVVTTPSVSTPEESANAATAGAQADKDDTKNDTGKKSQKRRLRMNKPATWCATEYRKRKKAGDKPVMKDIVEEYVNKNPGSSFSYTRRILNDNGDQWKDDTKDDTKTTS